MNNTWFLILRHDVLPTFHCLLRSFVFRWVALNPTGTKVLYHDCVMMLQTRFVLCTENFLKRRKSTINFLLDDEHGLLALPGRFGHGARDNDCGLLLLPGGSCTELDKLS